MFDFQRQVRLKQAENAFKDGRLDEAFAIASEKEIRDLRGGQLLLEGLVDPLLGRASDHFAGGRLKEALLDVEKAIHAGGNRPEAAQLRMEIRAAMEKREVEGRREREAIESARAHFLHGSLRTGLAVLETAPPGSSEAERIRREVEGRERKASEARTRARSHLEQGDLIEALTALGEAAISDARHEELSELKSKAKKLTVDAIEAAIESGDLKNASDLTTRLLKSVGDSLEARRLAGTISLCDETSRAILRGDLDSARVAVARLERELPRVTWVKEACSAVMKVSDGTAALRAGPLGRQIQAVDGPSHAARNAPTVAGNIPVQPLPSYMPGPQAQPSASNLPGTLAAERCLLWVDGVGTYLILKGDRVSFGRSGSSAHPEIALAADIAGLHAEIMRTDDDYFVVAAQGKVEVGGQAVTRRLLTNGDSVVLGGATRLLFELPTPLSPSAVLTLKNQRIEGDVRKVILLKNNLLIGASENCHVQVSAKTGRAGTVILSEGPAGLTCRADEEILLSGRPAGREATIPLGSHVQIGELTFTITGSVRNPLV